ncbi:MAG: F0F1 ATP synthase subunit A [Myxococcota bacterium]
MNIYAPLEHALHIPWVLQAAVLAAGLICLAGVLVRRQIAAAGGGVVPDEGVTLRNALEVIIDALATLARDVMGEDWRRYFPIVGTIFVFILVSNLMNLVPGVGGATRDANTTWAWAIISFVAYNAIGIHKHGVWYINQFLGPSFFEVKLFGRTVHVRLLCWFFFPLEMLLHAARMLTLSVRLLANMFADHAVVVVMMALVPIAIPAIFMGLGLLVAVIQAFVFALLTMIYIGSALAEPH